MTGFLNGRRWRPSLASGGLPAVLGATLCLLALAAPAQAQVGVDKALGRPASASSTETVDIGFGCGGIKCVPAKGNDGVPTTRWGSAFLDNQYWTVDLGAARLVDTVAITWEVAYAKKVRISVSSDNVTYTPVYEADITLSPAAAALLELTKRFDQRIGFPAQSARFVRITGLARTSPTWGISFWNASVFGPPDPVPAPLVPVATPGPATPVTPFSSTGTVAPPSATPPAPAPAPAPVQSPGATRLLAPFPVIRIVGTATASGASIRRLIVRAPRSASVRVRCRGGGCPRKDLRRRGPGSVRGIQGTLRVGAVIQVFVTQKGRVGKYTRFVIRKGQAPGRLDRCLNSGSRRPVRCP